MQNVDDNCQRRARSNHVSKTSALRHETRRSSQETELSKEKKLNNGTLDARNDVESSLPKAKPSIPNKLSNIMHSANDYRESSQQQKTKPSITIDNVSDGTIDDYDDDGGGEAAPPQKQKKVRAGKLTDRTLDITYGKRLRHDPPHWPKMPITGRPKCALHRWASSLEQKAAVVMCSVCHIHLCVDCFEMFHTIENLIERKEEIGQTFLDKKLEHTKLDWLRETSLSVYQVEQIKAANAANAATAKTKKRTLDDNGFDPTTTNDSNNKSTTKINNDKKRKAMNTIEESKEQKQKQGPLEETGDGIPATTINHHNDNTTASRTAHHPRHHNHNNTFIEFDPMDPVRASPEIVFGYV